MNIIILSQNQDEDSIATVDTEDEIPAIDNEEEKDRLNRLSEKLASTVNEQQVSLIWYLTL